MSAATPDPPAAQESTGAAITPLPETPPPGQGPLPLLPRTPAAPINLTLSADGLLLIGVAGGLVWRRFLREAVLTGAARVEHQDLELSRVVRGRMLRPPIWRRLFNAWAER
ncbi:MAG: hypothetical protein WBN89_09765 [Prochlorococcaceae cyanobacterium]